MSNENISDQILKWIRINSEQDEIIEHFLTELICEEAEHPSQWWWKETYKQKINKFSEKWKESHED